MTSMWMENLRTMNANRAEIMRDELRLKTRQEYLAVGFQMLSMADESVMYAAFNPDPRVLDIAIEGAEKMRKNATDFILNILEGRP